MGVGSSPRIVGRGEELARLRAAFEAATAGEATALVIGGEAGVGKTRLVREFLGGLDEPTHVIPGRCMARMAGGLPYGAFRDGLRTLVRSLEGAELRELRARTSPELAYLVPALGEPEPVRGPGPGAGQSRIFELVLQTVAYLAEQRPVVLAIDDLHWADRSTLSLLGFLIELLTSEPVLICATYRSDELDRAHPLRAWLAEHLRRRIASLELRRLKRSEIAEQAEAILGAPAPDGLVDDIFARSQGNPFFVEELLASGAHAGAGLPTSVRELLLARVAQPSDGCRALVRAASTARAPIDPWVLGRVLDVDESRLFDLLREAVEHHILEPDRDGRRFLFRHTLLREAAYSDLLPGERQHLHRLFAEAIGAARAAGRIDAAEASSEEAFHYNETGDSRRALEASLAAATAAMAARGFEIAEDHYRRVLDLWTEVPDAAAVAGLGHTDVLAKAAEAAHLSGDEAGAVAMVGAALEATDADAHPMDAALLYESLGWYLLAAGAPEDAVEVYESALELSGGTPERVERARILAHAGLGYLLIGDHGRAKELCEEAVGLARRLGATKEEGLALNPLGVAVAFEGRFDDGIAYLRRALELAERGDDVEAMVRPYVNLGHVLAVGGRLKEAVDVSLHGAAVAREHGLETTYGVFLTSNAADALFELGRWDEMRDAIETIERTSRSRTDIGFMHLIAARLYVARGDLDEARRRIDEARSLLADGRHPDILRGLHEVSAELALWERDPSRARDLAMDGLRALAGSAEHVFTGRLLRLALRALADIGEYARARRAGADERAATSEVRAVLDLARGLERDPLDPSRSPLPEAPALATTARAEAGRCDGRREPNTWERAAALWDELGRPYEGAYSRWRCAEAALLARETGPRAREALRAAYGIAVGLGARPLLEEIELLARRARISLETDVVPADEAAPELGVVDRSGLTDRELEVLRYIAEGLSNRQIAERLFISPKTASNHVSNVLHKMGVGGRVEAAAVAFRMGLLPRA